MRPWLGALTGLAGLAGTLPCTTASAAVLQVGPGRADDLPSAAAAAAEDGDTVEIAPGSYFDCAIWRASGLTIIGAGPGVEITDKACGGKAAFVIQGDGVTVRNLGFARIRVADGNGAGIRAEGRDLSVIASRFDNNQVGILASGTAGTLRISGSTFTANGVSGGLHGRKGDMWEGGIRVPAVIEWPARIKKPAVTQMPAGVIDIYPTIVDLIGAKVPNQVEPLDGISLVPLIDGRLKERPRPMGFWQYIEEEKALGTDAGSSAWNDNRFKLHKHKPGMSDDLREKIVKHEVKYDVKYELYDLTADLAETTDIAAQHPEIVKRMKAELEDWQQSVLRSDRGEDYKSK